ncbi:MAG: restriction endonuclease subunit S [Phycisphaerae bacterium]|nr:restriction endonuclease subunit S [Saprospiraceae bacterium]
MAAQMANMNLNNLDRSGWKTYRFEQIAKSISERVDPNNTDLKIYVGLEHLDAENIHIKRYGTPDDVDGQKLRCYPGDVIFGKRRAYQRKAAVVDFDGFCSAHAMVLRANPEVIDPQLFPFFLHSDTFMHRAIDISVGSLSPTINWGTLKTQEFLLPPKDQQAKLAELLWAMDAVVEKEMGVKDHLESIFTVFLNSYLQNGVDLVYENNRKLGFGKVYKKWPIKKLDTFCKLVGGNAFKSERFKSSGNFQVLRIGNLTNSGFSFLKAPVFINEVSESEKKYLIPEGAIVLSLTGTHGKRDYGFPSLMSENNVYFLNQRLVMLVPDKREMLPEFLFFLSKLEIFQGRFFLNETGTANQANVSIQDVSKIELPVPPLEEQKIIVKNLNSVRVSLQNIKVQIATSKSLQKSLINQIF